MEDEKKETQDANIEEDKTSKNEEEIDSIEDIEQLKKDFKTSVIQKTKLRTKNIELQKALDEIEPKKETKEEKKPSLPDNDRLDILDFSYDHKEITREEAKKIQKYASALGLSMEEAYKDEFIMAGIEKRIKAEASEGADVNSNRSPRIKAKSVQYKPGMSRDEFKKLVESQ